MLVEPAVSDSVAIASLFCKIIIPFACDSWVRTGLDCAEILPKGCRIVQNYIDESNDIVQKLNLYHGVVSYYTALGESIIPQGFGDVMVTVLNLIMQGRDDKAIRALQLVVLLIPRDTCLHLERIIHFMKAVADDENIVFDDQLTNQEVVERALRSCIIKNEMLNIDQSRQIVLYLIDHCRQIFTVPTDVRLLADRRVLAMRSGRLDTILETTFCDRVSKETYEEQSGPGTDRELVQLMNIILDDTKMSLKEKKQRIKQFQKHHPALFTKHFCDYL